MWKRRLVPLMASALARFMPRLDLTPVAVAPLRELVCDRAAWMGWSAVGKEARAPAHISAPCMAQTLALAHAAP